jgi:hypothetical protein
MVEYIAKEMKEIHTGLVVARREGRHPSLKQCTFIELDGITTKGYPACRLLVLAGRHRADLPDYVFEQGQFFARMNAPWRVGSRARYRFEDEPKPEELVVTKIRRPNWSSDPFNAFEMAAADGSLMLMGPYELDFVA